jgi:hypothetical protein
MRLRPFVFVVVAAIVMHVACSKRPDQTAKPHALTQAQRDSAIAASKLPGAGVVGKALEVADSAESRANQPIPEP